MSKNKLDIISLINSAGCFDLQFRKDSKSGRTNSPTYYRFKAQFILTSAPSGVGDLEEVHEKLQCGRVYLVGNQSRFAIQNIDELNEVLIPYLEKNKLENVKQKEFSLWKKSVEIILKNKRKSLLTWEKSNFNNLIEIQKKIQKLKGSKPAKWLEIAEQLAGSIGKEE